MNQFDITFASDKGGCGVASIEAETKDDARKKFLKANRHIKSGDLITLARNKRYARKLRTG